MSLIKGESLGDDIIPVTYTSRRCLQKAIPCGQSMSGVLSWCTNFILLRSMTRTFCPSVPAMYMCTPSSQGATPTPAGCFNTERLMLTRGVNDRSLHYRLLLFVIIFIVIDQNYSNNNKYNSGQFCCKRASYGIKICSQDDLYLK